MHDTFHPSFLCPEESGASIIENGIYPARLLLARALAEDGFHRAPRCRASSLKETVYFS